MLTIARQKSIVSNVKFAPVKFAICNEIFQGWKLEATMEYARKAGYDGLEIAPFTLAPLVTDVSQARRREIRDAAARAGIQIPGLHWLLARTEGMHLSDPDPAVRGWTAAYLCELVDFCADIGGKVLVLGSPQQRNVLAGATAQQAWDLAAQTLSDAVKRAEDLALTICFEPLAPTETNFINTASQAIQFAGQFHSPGMKIILDVKAMSWESEPIPQIIRAAWPHFAHFHANDKNLKGPGFGEIDFAPIAAALHEVGYNGYVSVEVFNFDEGPEVIATRSLGYLRRTFGSDGPSRKRAIGI
jgi:sugar phosphate isomerase/epimerase